MKGYNLKIKFTKISNKCLSLTERAKMANNFKSDYFLSIHMNTTKANTVRGVEV